MNQLSRLTGDSLKAASTTQGGLGSHAVLREHAEVPVRDGRLLSSDIYHPAGQADGPVILMRTPYGRANWTDEGIYWASHGYHMMVQDSRGTSSYFAEAADGADTVKWIEQAPWLGNALLLKGFSYLGFTAWATASTRPASLRALSIQVYSSDRVSSWYPGGSFGLDNALPWTAGQASAVDSSDRSLDLAIPGPDDASFNHLPLLDADIALTGAPVPFYRDRLRYDGADPHWAPVPADVDLGPLEYRLSAGHALRVQVSSGAHPVCARNPGGTEPPAITTELRAATQRIHLGGRHASQVTIDISRAEIDIVPSAWDEDQ